MVARNDRIDGWWNYRKWFLAKLRVLGHEHKKQQQQQQQQQNLSRKVWKLS
jgi:hypothetical protein